MVRKSVLLASTALAGLMTAQAAVAQPARSLEDRVRALEQLLGQSPNAGADRSLEARVEALEAQIQQRVMEDDARAARLSTVEAELAQEKADDEAEAQRLMAPGNAARAEGGGRAHDSHASRHARAKQRRRVVDLRFQPGDDPHRGQPVPARLPRPLPVRQRHVLPGFRPALLRHGRPRPAQRRQFPPGADRRRRPRVPGFQLRVRLRFRQLGHRARRPDLSLARGLYRHSLFHDQCRCDPAQIHDGQFDVVGRDHVPGARIDHQHDARSLRRQQFAARRRADLSARGSLQRRRQSSDLDRVHRRADRRHQDRR